ncbi:MAG: hypothetical protein AAF789_08470, partial [Bacteroidota bacterium]
MKLRLACYLLLLCTILFGYSQQIVVDTSSTSRYFKKEISSSNEIKTEESEPTFSDRAMSIGVAIMNRLKARFNLEDAAESLKEKKDRVLNKPK